MEYMPHNNGFCHIRGNSQAFLLSSVKTGEKIHGMNSVPNIPIHKDQIFISFIPFLYYH